MKISIEPKRATETGHTPPILNTLTGRLKDLIPQLEITEMPQTEKDKARARSAQIGEDPNPMPREQTSMNLLTTTDLEVQGARMKSPSVEDPEKEADHITEGTPDVMKGTCPEIEVGPPGKNGGDIEPRTPTRRLTWPELKR